VSESAVSCNGLILFGLNGHFGGLQMVRGGSQLDGSGLSGIGTNDGEAKAVKGFAVMGGE
jgi:hypothetical protein